MLIDNQINSTTILNDHMTLENLAGYKTLNLSNKGHLIKEKHSFLEEEISLDSLNISGDTSLKGLNVFLQKPLFAHLKVLNLACNVLNCKETEEIASYLKENKHLTHLNLVDCKIGPLGAQALSLTLKTSILKTLELDYNPLENKGVISLSEALKGNESLSSLYLTKCDFSEEGGIKLGEALACNNSLINLVLNKNLIKIEGIRALIMAIRINKSLMNISIAQMGISEDIMKDVSAAIFSDDSFKGSLQGINRIGPVLKTYCVINSISLSEVLKAENLQFSNMESKKFKEHLEKVENKELKLKEVFFLDLNLEEKEIFSDCIKTFKKMKALTFIHCGIKA